MSRPSPFDGAISRRDFLRDTTAAFAVACGASALGQSSRSASAAAFGRDAETLRDIAASRGLLYGAAARQRVLATDSAFAAAFASECGLLVPEDDLKWDRVEPTSGAYDFARGEWLAGFAEAHRQLLRGGPLVWHQSLPNWISALGAATLVERALREHVTVVAGHFRGRMHSWDVVNEAVGPWDRRADGLRRTLWLERLGPNYMDVAFHAAAEADPKALLVYNDHLFEYATDACRAQRSAVLRLLEGMLHRGVPVQALGIQGHLDAADPRFDDTGFAAFVREVTGLGLPILVTELDAADDALPADIEGRDRAVAQSYARFLDVVLASGRTRAVITWGLSDRYTWLSSYRSRSDHLPVRTLPLDADLRPTPAWTAIANALRQLPPAPVRPS